MTALDDLVRQAVVAREGRLVGSAVYELLPDEMMAHMACPAALVRETDAILLRRLAHNLHGPLRHTYSAELGAVVFYREELWAGALP